MRCQTALKAREIVWKEIITELVAKDPILRVLDLSVKSH